jgi:hypothetical protein
MLEHLHPRIEPEAAMRFSRFSFSLLLMTVAAANTSSIALSVAAPTPQRLAPSAFQLQNKTFEFPGAGERNNNETIGDFCCTGETATIRTVRGMPTGFIYFYGFSGGITNGKRSAAKRFRVLVSGSSDPVQPAAVRAKSSIDFAATEMKPGLTHQTIAGALQFTATIQDVQFLDEAHSRFWMDSVKIKVEVQEAPLPI